MNFLDKFSKSTLKLIEFRPVGAELLQAGKRTDGQRGLMKLQVAFRISPNALRPVTLTWYDAVRANLSLKNERHASECNVILIVCSIKRQIRYSVAQRLGNCVGSNS